MPAHVPDPAAPCLEVGARELWLVGEPLVAATLPGTAPIMANAVPDVAGPAAPVGREPLSRPRL